MRVIDPAGFEALFRRDSDPWNYAASRFEAHKRRILLRACGTRCRGRILELGCANGETALRLAALGLRLTALDASPSVLAAAERRLAGRRRVRLRQARLPGGIPRGRFDLVIVSELVYYLGRRDADELSGRILAALAPGGRVVVLDHHIAFDDAAQKPAVAHARAVRRFGRLMPHVFAHRDARFVCDAFDRPSSGFRDPYRGSK